MDPPIPTQDQAQEREVEEGQPPMGYVANFTSVLNTPMEESVSLTSLYEYLTTSQASEIPGIRLVVSSNLPQDHIPIEEVTMDQFSDYLAEFGQLTLLAMKARHTADAKRAEADTTVPTGLGSISESYYHSEFSLLDPGVLEEGNSGVIVPGHTLMLEKMSTQLDAVEMRLISQISKRSDAIFASLVDFQHINERVRVAVQRIKKLRQLLMKMENDMVSKALRVAQLKRKRANTVALSRMIHLIQTVNQTQPTVQLLLSTSDFAGALDLLESTQEILSGELSGVHAFKHLHAQLSELGGAIERMMQSEFLRTALDVTVTDEGSRAQLDAVLVPLVLGLRRVGRLQTAIQEYREKAVERVRPTLRSTVMTGNGSDKEASASELAGVVRDQDPNEFLELLDALFVVMSRFIDRSHVVHQVVWGVLSDGVQSGDPTLDFDTGYTGETAASEALETVVAVAEECHQRIARLLQLRDEVHARLSFKDFVKLYTSVTRFIGDGEKLCSRSLRGLRGPLLQQSKLFLDTYHAKESQSLSLLLDNELWQQCEVLDIFQNAVHRWTEITTGVKPDAASGAKFLEANGKKYKAVNVLLFLIRMADDYLRIAEMFPSLTTDVLGRMVELFKLFNSRTCQLVLGAGALQLAGLKSITATHLALVSQCLGLLVDQIPVIAIMMGRLLPSTHAVLLTELDRVVEDCAHHRQEIFTKLVSIMRERVDYHCRNIPKIAWDQEIESEGASQYVQSMSKETATMHKKLAQTLQFEELRKVFGLIVQTMIHRWGGYIDGCKIETPLGRRRLRLDVRYFMNVLKGLKGIDPPGTELLDKIYSKSGTTIDEPPTPPKKPKPARRFMDL